MKEKDNSLTIRAIRLLPFIGVIAFALIFLIAGKDVNVNTLLTYSPNNLLLAALFLILIYAVKSLSFFFPIIVLEIAGGIIFPVGIAIIVNVVGNVVCLTLPYLIGRFSGDNLTAYLIKKHPKLQDFYDRQKNNEWFLSFFLRAISCLPGDIVSMYLGSQDFSYPVFLTGSLAGSIFGIIAATVVGDSILDPSSPKFKISVAATVLIAVCAVVYYFLSKKHRRVRKRAD